METPKSDLQGKVNEYIQAFEARDLERCLAFYWDDASIKFHVGRYEGREGIEQWHRDRFEADMRLVRIDAIRVQGDGVLVESAIKSKKLQAWKIKELCGSVNFTFKGGKIREAKFSLRMYNPFEGW